VTDVRIHYLRPPDRRDLYTQKLVHRGDDVVVTLLERTPLERPLRVGDAVVLEDGAPVVWFTFPGAWHDIGRFHRADGTFTGIYANILEPVHFRGPLEWDATDLFLDVWVGADGRVALLDEDELEEALAAGWIDAATGRRAREEAQGLLDAAARGSWPPAVVNEWTLEAARRAAHAC
jgi:predicted RNA-binding protein associated with RNAse of E/G family